MFYKIVMKKSLWLVVLLLVSVLIFAVFSLSNRGISYGPSHPLVDAAREQIGVVTKYDTSYYAGGYPPADRGACTDVVVRALLDLGYDLKEKVDEDMRNHPEEYANDYDSNINFRRVVNLDVYFQRMEESLTTELSSDTLDQWQAGDVVVFDQIPGRLWHIAIVSNKKNSKGIPFIVHNHGRGTVENDLILRWSTPIIGHYRMDEWELIED